MIYLDHQATTPCDPRVVEVMLPWLTDQFGNPHSESHEMGRTAAEVIERSISEMAALIGAPADSMIVTSGATESNNLAIRGVGLHPRQKKRHLVTVATEHPAVLDVVADLEREGFRVSRVDAHPNGHPLAGAVDLEKLANTIDDDTALVSVMWANNEIGTITPMRDVTQLCHNRGVLVHCDASQAVGRLPIDVVAEDIDLLSGSAHKFYGPKGVGFLVAGNGLRRVRLKPQIVGGGQQQGIRSGTMNPASIVAMSKAMSLCIDEMEQSNQRVGRLRDNLFRQLSERLGGIELNGPPLSDNNRLPGNLNVLLDRIEGEAWMSATPGVAFSSGSACSSVDPQASHVIRAIGRSESEARRSVRFGIGRFNSNEEITAAADQLVQAYEKLVDHGRS